MQKVLLLIAIVLILASCKEKTLVGEMAVVDSFVVNGVVGMDEILCMSPLNDTTLVSYSIQSSELSYYTQTSSNSYVRSRPRKLLEDSYIFSFSVINSKKFCLIDNYNRFYFVDSGLQIQQINNNDNKEYLGRNFLNPDLKNIPVMFDQNDFTATHYYRKLHDTTALGGYEKYFKEPVLCNYTIADTVISATMCYAPKPDGLIDFFMPFPKYCSKGNDIVVLYPCFDTLYIYDKTNGKERKVYIGNSHYSVPDKFDYKKIVDIENLGSYQTKYKLTNFQYLGIYYNSLTEHYMLFYNTPIRNKNNYEKQKLQLLVLDKNYSYVKQYSFNNDYFSTENFLFIKNKGLALPVFKNDYSGSNSVVYYLYNF